MAQVQNHIKPDGSLFGTGLLQFAHAQYNFGVDGGASCTPASNATIPQNAVMVGATINSTTAMTAAGAATMSIGTTAGSSATSILAATGKASYSTNALINGAVTFAAPVKMSAAGNINVTIATGPLTAGVVEIYVYYYVSST